MLCWFVHWNFLRNTCWLRLVCDFSGQEGKQCTRKLYLLISIFVQTVKIVGTDKHVTLVIGQNHLWRNLARKRSGNLVVKILCAEWTTQWRCLEKKTQSLRREATCWEVVLSAIFLVPEIWRNFNRALLFSFNWLGCLKAKSNSQFIF